MEFFKGVGFAACVGFCVSLPIMFPKPADRGGDVAFVVMVAFLLVGGSAVALVASAINKAKS